MDFTEPVVNLFIFYLALLEIFAPPPRRWSVDVYFGKVNGKATWFSSFILRMCQITLAISYINAGVAKSLGNHWWTGEALWRVLNQPNYQQFDISWLGAYPLLFISLGCLTLLHNLTGL